MAQGIPSKPALKLLERGITITELARELHISPQAVSQHINGQTKELPRELLRALEARLDADTGLEVLQAILAAREARQEASA
jgi:predicted transcriptional regulator